MGIDDQNNAELDLCHLLLHMHTLRITSVRGSVAGTAGCQRVDSRQLAVSHTYQLTYQNYHPRFPHVQTLFQISTDAPHRQASAPAAHLSLVASKILEPYDAQNELRTKAMSILGLRTCNKRSRISNSYSYPDKDVCEIVKEYHERSGAQRTRCHCVPEEVGCTPLAY
jgi:hypothetical protein